LASSVNMPYSVGIDTPEYAKRHSCQEETSDQGVIGTNNADNKSKGRFQHAPSPQKEIQRPHAMTSHITCLLYAICSREGPIISGLSAYALAPRAQLAAVKGGLCRKIDP